MTTKHDPAEKMLDRLVLGRTGANGITLYLWPEEGQEIDVWINGEFTGIFRKRGEE